MIENYSARWEIESGFKELKHEIGTLDNQVMPQSFFQLGVNTTQPRHSFGK